MRVAVYNQMFGMNGKNLFSFIHGHWKVHFQKSFVKDIKATLDRTVDTIKESNSDIACICEVLEDQEGELTEKLSDQGYNYAFYEKGHRTRFRKEYVEVAIVSKIKCQKIDIEGFPLRNEMGGGGGVIHCYFSDLDTHLINLHLASVKKDVHKKQLDFIEDYVQKLNGNIILLGDFNVSYNRLKTKFKKLNLVSEEIKTCPVTFGLKFMMKDLDHILIRGFKKQNAGFFEGYSDHRLIYADLE